ncbi:nucleoside triphosphate pyrophosphohydrolase [Tepidamorphus sp. 3E244]|uniref:nucleoside triphosphate pyrophosphohydrolase n=1 Tax=Tepidamorphus sp. 3E244 TaxID=3385498 RepID=UPI0038FCFDCE
MSRPIDDLLAVMAQLRDPDTGCPWDVQQDFASIIPYTIEEAYEVADAIERDDMADLKDELGDLLLQVVFHARMAEEAGLFAFGDVVASIHDKMVRRHPHVFGDGHATDADGVRETWEAIKARERAAKGKMDARRFLDDVPANLPALLRAQKLQKRAARAAFDWPDVDGALEKLTEELDELEAARNGDGNVAEEAGDALFAMVNVVRKLGVDVEDALRGTNAKFCRRFAQIEDEVVAAGHKLGDVPLEELDAAWNRAKARERQ